MKTLKSFSAFILVSTLLALAAGCGGQGDTAPPVKLAYVEWSSEVASTNVVRAVLQERLDRRVEITPVSAAAMWKSVETGDYDGLVAAWLPTTHSHYLEQVGDRVENLGPNLEGTRIGLVVPAYVEIDSIDQLNEHAERLGGRIIGIDPGAGLMSKTETVLEEYGLDRFELMEGSGAIMTAALADAIKAKKWIVVTGWTPHWKFARWDLKYLDDSRNVYGGAETICTIVRRGLEDDMPEVYRFLDRFHWTPQDMEALMQMNQESGADPYENAKTWIEKHPQKVDNWIK